MDFELTDEQKMIVQAASEVAKDFGPEYWREKDKSQVFPEDFWKALVDVGFVGAVIPEKYAGGGMGSEYDGVAISPWSRWAGRAGTRLPGWLRN